MPRRQSRRRPSKTVTRRRRKRKSNPRLRVGGFPIRMMAKLRYVQTKSYDAGAGTFSNNSFRANSLFDPDSTGTGHQPSNFDKLATIYDKYTVIGAKIKLYPVPLSSTSVSPPPTVVCCLSEAGTTISTAHAAGGIDNVLEQPGIKRTTQYNVTSGSGIQVLTMYFSAKKFFGLSQIVGMGDYAADVATNPSEGAFFEVAAISPDDTVNPATIDIRAEIEYVAVFTEPKLTDAS